MDTLIETLYYALIITCITTLPVDEAELSTEVSTPATTVAVQTLPSNPSDSLPPASLYQGAEHAKRLSEHP